MRAHTVPADGDDAGIDLDGIAPADARDWLGRMLLIREFESTAGPLATSGAIPGGMLHLGGLGRPGRASRFRPRPDGSWVGLDGYFTGETLRLDPVALNLATFVFTRTPYDPDAPVPGGVDEAGWRRG